MPSPLRSVDAEDSIALVRRIPHRTYNQAQCVGFTGRRGCGKTFALNRYINALEPRVFALDPFDDFEGLQLPDPADSYQEALADLAHYKTCRRRVISPVDENSRDYAEEIFEAMISGEYPLRDALVVLDEMTLHTRPHASAALEKLVLQGRRFGLRLAIASQRIALLPGIVLSEMTELMVFKTTRPRDLEVLAEWGGKDLAAKAPSLQIGQACLIIL